MLSRFPVLMTQARLAIRAFSLSETKVYQHTVLCRRIIEEVCWFNISMQNMVFVYALQRREQRAKVDGNIRYCHVPKICSEVTVAKVRQYGDYLIGGAEGRDQRTDRRALAQIVQQLQLVQDTGRARCDIDLFYRDISCLLFR